MIHFYQKQAHEICNPTIAKKKKKRFVSKKTPELLKKSDTQKKFGFLTLSTDKKSLPLLSIFMIAELKT